MTFAVIRTGGKQYKVAEGQKIKIEKLDAKENEVVVFDDVLLLGDDKKTQIGQPLVKGAKVEGMVLAQKRAKKIVIIKYKSKKRYQVKRGHRQSYSEVEITKINA